MAMASSLSAKSHEEPPVKRARVDAAAASAAASAVAEPPPTPGKSLAVLFDVGSSSIRAAVYALPPSSDGSPAHGAATADSADHGAALSMPIKIEGTQAKYGATRMLDTKGYGDASNVLAACEAVLDECLEKLKVARAASEVVAGLASTSIDVDERLAELSLPSSREVCTTLQAGSKIEAVGFASAAMTLVGVDASGAPVTPVYSYARKDDAAESHVEGLRERITKDFGAGAVEALYQETGAPLHSAYAPALFEQLSVDSPELLSKVRRILPTREAAGGRRRPLEAAVGMLSAAAHARPSAPNRPSGCEVCAKRRLYSLQPATFIPSHNPKVHKWQTITSFVLAQWCGVPAAPVSTSDASWTGLLDVRRGCWSKTLVDALDCGAALPELRDYSHGNALQADASGEISGGEGGGGGGGGGAPLVLDGEHAARWPDVAKVPLYLAVGDGAAANLGSKVSGCLLRGYPRLSVTVLVFCSYFPPPPTPHKQTKEHGAVKHLPLFTTVYHRLPLFTTFYHCYHRLPTS